jgi:Leucine-rich repeat (LRR) protein
MKLFLRRRIVAAVLVLLGFCALYAFQPLDMPAGNQAQQVKTESDAEAALFKLGVPLQKDNQGVVRWIEATNAELSDEALQYLPRFSKLEWLEIGGGKVSPSEISKLKGCTSLVRLYIHDVKLGNDELAWLSSLTKLEALSLQRTGINGKVLKNLATGGLTVLNLSGNDIGDDDMVQIARLKNLEVLALSDTKITGAGITKLEGMKRLNEFNIMRCPIRDSDLEPFLSMPNLRIVYAEGCNITDIGIQSVVSRFPMLAIFH